MNAKEWLRDWDAAHEATRRQRALAAFDALLAVAKATDQSRNFTRMFNADMTEALDALSAAHPDWRTWT